MENLGSTNVPTPFDFGRFFKVVRTLNTFLQKDEEVFTLLKNKLNTNQHFTENSLLIINDFYNFIGVRD